MHSFADSLCLTALTLMEYFMSEYGDRFEGPTIVAMSIAIVISLVAVSAMWVAAQHDCIASNYTYCGELPGHH